LLQLGGHLRVVRRPLLGLAAPFLIHWIVAIGVKVLRVPRLRERI
jgi:hypothetical protein